MATRYPVSTIAGMRRAMDRMASDAFSPSQFATLWPAAVSQRGQSAFPVDVYATDDAVIVLAAAPGIAASDLEITVEKNTVSISANIPSVATSDHAREATWYLHELPRGAFQRTLTLPMEVDSARAQATIENGVLRLELPKSEAARPRQIQVQAATPVADAPEIAEVASESEESNV